MRPSGPPSKRFNGATPRWAWKTAQGMEDLCRGTSFNGATPRWAWKTQKIGRPCGEAATLQWGHATMGVENAGLRHRRPAFSHASMGPRHDGRGKLDRDVDRDEANNASMGPRHDGRGKLRQAGLGAGNRPASMGPRHDGRGKPVRALEMWLTALKLQWGHATMGVENPPGVSPCLFFVSSFNGATPRWAWKTQRVGLAAHQLVGLQWGHATMGVENPCIYRLRARSRLASMGPRHDGRGKPVTPAGGNPELFVLQWGHATMGVENAASPSGVDVILELQWGHATMGVENRAGERVEVRVAAASMGPRHDGRGKLVRGDSDGRGGKRASMGPRHDGRGKRVPGRDGRAVRLRFNGATPRWAWKTPRTAARNPGASSFNGATPRWAWKTETSCLRVPWRTCFNGATAPSS